MSNKYVIVGLPCAGKSKFAKKLEKDLAIPHFSLGNIFRNIIDVNDKNKDSYTIARDIKPYVETGAIVPNNIVREVLVWLLDEVKHATGIIIDDFPRNLEQVKLLQELIPDANIIYLEVPDFLAKYRSRKRNRADDTAEIFGSRLKQSKEDINAVLKYLNDNHYKYSKVLFSERDDTDYDELIEYADTLEKVFEVCKAFKKNIEKIDTFLNKVSKDFGSFEVFIRNKRIYIINDKFNPITDKFDSQMITID